MRTFRAVGALIFAFLILVPFTARADDLEVCKAQTPESYNSCKRLADAGDADGLFGLGLLYLQGIGVEKDYVKSFQLMYRAANLGNPYAQLQVGQAYVNGQGVRQDFEEGYAWFLVAKENGNDLAQEGIAFLNQRQMVKDSRLDEITRRANYLYAQTKVKHGFTFDPTESRIPVSGIEEFCEMVMPTVDDVILLKRLGNPRSDAHQLMIGMTDERAIEMMEGLVNWVWSSKVPADDLHEDFKRKCLIRSNEVGFMFQ